MKHQKTRQKRRQQTLGIVLMLLIVMGCRAPVATPTLPPTSVETSPETPRPTITPTDEGDRQGLSDDEIATLSSLKQVDDYPLYTMHYHGAYNQNASFGSGLVKADWLSLNVTTSMPAWACSLFAALGDAEDRLYGRNFDWQYSPAVLLFTDPPDGYASVSMVDIAYLVEPSQVLVLTDLPLVERQALLYAPFMPFDGMNEHGLAVGMAAVPGSQMPYDGAKETVSSLRVIREMLDHARNVDEATAILQSYNIDWQGGPPLHYLIADTAARAVLVEFYQGQMVVMPNETPWHLATNFLRTAAGETAEGRCWRYDIISERLAEAEGQIAVQDALDVLGKVSQGGTQWSIVYGMSSGDVNMAMGRQYETVHTFHLSLAGE